MRFIVINVRFKRVHQLTPIPKRATLGAAAVDLTAVDAKVNYAKGYIEYRTGLSVSIPSGYAGFIFPRSSISNTPHSLANACGIIDEDYRGEITVRMRFGEYSCSGKESDVYSIGDRVAQMVIMTVPEVEYEEVDELDETMRGSGGYGSTGKR